MQYNCLNNRSDEHGASYKEPLHRAWRFRSTKLFILTRVLIRRDIRQQQPKKLRLEESQTVLRKFEKHSECIWATIGTTQSDP